MTESVALPELRPEVRAALDEALSSASGARGESLRAVVASDPLCLEGWARLGEETYAAGDDVAAYAFYRVGYHRGLDVLRSVGWRPGSLVPHSTASNRGFLMALHGLMRSAAAINEGVEARRCREFLLQLDPTDPFEAGGIQPKTLSSRLD